ncbi:MAG: SDR family oxidoreductase [Chloroflexota bacterium]|nr:SDR family oxidoreductase [Chloroflexota bacterium]
MLKEYDLTGKVAIVTGAAKGIGKGIALTLADAGADIAAADVDAEGLKSLSDDINSMGRRCLAITTDVTDEAQVRKMVDEATSKLGPIDILVNNAGKGNRRVVVPLENQNIKPMTDEDWESVMNLNVKAILHCVRAVGPQMIERRRGKIIIIISAVAVASFDYNSLYCISKAAAARFVQTLAREWAPYNINVNGIGPSWTMTEAAQMMLEYKGEEYVKKEMERMPLGRAAQPREIGLLAVYLASEASDMVTGQNIFIDGGLTGAV